ncbi:hypothetical protein F4604DRAFT_1942564 [Suillus subluteus]|nr:hypothetical protein F4604DRAFT_1942564 [Suillus subluteus]
MAVTYGHTDLGAQDPFLACAQELLDIARHLLSPERAAMFAAFPFLKRLPVWCFHGAYALMGCSRELCHQLLDEPFNEVKAQMANGTTSQSLVADFLSQADNDADKDMMKAVALMGCIDMASQGHRHIYIHIAGILDGHVTLSRRPSQGSWFSDVP